jgi:hypothetical protein
MKTGSSTIKIAALIAALAYFAGMAVPVFVPQAQALYWEDDYEGNDPKERMRRPGGFFLFNWIDGLVSKSRRNQYGKLENRDTGSSVNGGRKTVLIVACGLVGLGTGVIIGSSTSSDENRTSNVFLGGALGLGAGVLLAAAIMPRDYQVDPVALSEQGAYRQAWLQDETLRMVRSAFAPSTELVKARF